jgi:hypothetical protein
MADFPGDGVIKCAGKTNGGYPCSKFEIDGMDYCLHHMPDDMLEEAEEIAGYKRCRERFGQPDACHYFALEGTEPPRCKNHGANAGSVIAKHAANNVIELKTGNRLAEVLADKGDRLLNPPPIENPLQELLDLAAEIKEFKNVMREMIMPLLLENKLRYTRDKVGEQIRAEIVLYERSLERLDRILTNISKLNILGKMAAIEERKVDAIERAMTLALQAANVDAPQREIALKVLTRELKAVAA